jgi:hypothetical protein
MTIPTNCDPGKPLIRPEGEGATLNYNLPQSSCFTAQASIPLGVDRSWFTDSTAQEPQVHWWNRPRPELDGLEQTLSDGDLTPEVAQFIDPRIPSLLHTTTVPAAASVPDQISYAPSRAAGLAATSRAARRGRQPSRRMVSPEPVHTASHVAKAIVDGLRPLVTSSFGGELQIKYLPPPDKPVPRMFLVEYYKVCSYLGDYGAGKTLSVTTMGPGEKLTMTVNTYRDSETTLTESENILDSFSQSSADELEQLVEQQVGVTDSSSVSNTVTSTTGGSMSVGVGVDLFGWVELGADTQVDTSRSDTTTVAATREFNTQALDRALSSHVESSSSSREVTVNTSSTTTVSTGESTSTVRELANINLSRVLNIAFRQLMQAYDTITYLDDVKVLYTNGYPESIRLIDLNQLDEVLPQLITPQHLDDVRDQILEPYCVVFNYQGKPMPFLEKVDRTYHCELTGDDEHIRYLRKRLDLRDQAGDITVPGVITSVQRNVLPTEAVMADGFLGERPLVDCYNSVLQATTADAADIANQKQRLAVRIIEAIEDPEARAKAWAQLFNPPPPVAAEPTEPATP